MFDVHGFVMVIDICGGDLRRSSIASRNIDPRMDEMDGRSGHGIWVGWGGGKFEGLRRME